MKLPNIFLSLTVGSFFFSMNAQGTIEDYNRAFGLAEKYNYGYVPNARIFPQWIGESDKFWYVDEKPDGSKDYTVVDAVRKKSAPLFDANALAAALKAKGIEKVDSRKLSLEGLQVSSNLDTLWFNRDGRMWTFIKSGKNHLIDRGEVPAPPVQPHWMVVDEEKDFDPVVSPDGKKVAFVRSIECGKCPSIKRFDFFVRHLLGVTPPAWSEIK